MKVLKDNTKSTEPKPYPRKCTCENCSSLLEYEAVDMYMGEYGCMYIDCPLCGSDNMLEDNEFSITLTFKNIEFPKHFGHECKENGCVDVFNQKEIKKDLEEAITYFRENKDAHTWSCQRGNLYLNVNRYERDREYVVTASNDYYQAIIPFEEEDY